MDPLDEARESLKALKIADTSRYDFIENVLEQMKAMQLEKVKARETIEDLERVRDSYRNDFVQSEAKLKHLKSSMARNSFILVLVDGDASPFRDDFVRQGTLGGDTAVRELRRSVVEYVSNSLGLVSEYEIVIRVYSKMQYLNRTYNRAGIMQGETCLQSFVQGFNRVNTLCEYIDAGNDKEGADHKVQDNLKLLVHNLHCKHVILCASSDDSYTGFLRDYVKNGQVSDAITLVEAIPFPYDLATISVHFRKTVFPDVFRNTKIMTKESDKVRKDSPILAWEKPATSTLNSMAGSPTGVATPAQTSDAEGTGRANISATILVNAANQRVDPKVPQYDPKIVAVLKDKMLCNQNFLSRCPFPPGKCGQSHQATLTAPDLAALRFIARLGACKYGIYCRDSACVASHMCIYGAKCKNPNRCRFPKAMHHLSSEPVGTVPASF